MSKFLIITTIDKPNNFLKIISKKSKKNNAGLVIVADGTSQMQKRINRVLTNDPGIGVARHLDAGYKKAIQIAHERNLKIPK